MGVISLVLAVSVYTIPAGTTYTLQASDPHIGADVTLGEDVSFQFGPGTRVDWCGKARPIRQCAGGQTLNGTYSESHPKGAAIVLR